MTQKDQTINLLFLEHSENEDCSAANYSEQFAYHTHVVDVRFNNRQYVTANLTVGEKVILRREPSKRYDHNAIRVERMDGAQVGYINRYLAEQLAPCLDQINTPITGVVDLILGNPFIGLDLGVIISFYLPCQQS